MLAARPENLHSLQSQTCPSLNRFHGTYRTYSILSSLINCDHTFIYLKTAILSDRALAQSATIYSFAHILVPGLLSKYLTQI